MLLTFNINPELNFTFAIIIFVRFQKLDIFNHLKSGNFYFHFSSFPHSFNICVEKTSAFLQQFPQFPQFPQAI